MLQGCPSWMNRILLRLILKGDGYIMARPAGFEPATLCLEGKCSSPTELRARNSILADVKSPSSSQPAECWMLTPERSRRSTALTACTAHRENRAMFCSYQRPRARVPGESQCKR